MRISWLKWGAVAIILALIICVVTYYYYTRLIPDCPGLNLDRIQTLRYEIIGITTMNKTNLTSTGNLILKVSRTGNIYEIERISDSSPPAGPNATYTVNKNGNITNIKFTEGRRDNSTLLFSAAKGSSFIFPEIIPIPENGIIVPQNWSSVINFNYTIRTTIPGYTTMFQQLGFSRCNLKAVDQISITTPAGTFNTIQIIYEKTISWTTRELHPITPHYPRDTGDKEETQVTGTYLIEPKTGILLQNTQSNDYRSIPNAYTLTITDIEPPLES